MTKIKALNVMCLCLISIDGCFTAHHKIKNIFLHCAFRFIKPLLTHARPPLTETLPQCCLPLAKLLTTDEQLQQVSNKPFFC